MGVVYVPGAVQEKLEPMNTLNEFFNSKEYLSKQVG